jgi:hypothetical protein
MGGVGLRSFQVHRLPYLPPLSHILVTVFCTDLILSADAAVQTDPIAVSLPLVVTRPSSPVFIEVKDTTEQSCAVKKELRDSQREVKTLKQELAEQKTAESAIAGALFSPSSPL